jgi:hypothetical protein
VSSSPLSRHPVRAGESFKVRCTIAHPRRVQTVTVAWQGREEAILRAYTDTRFVEPFLRQELVNFAHPLSASIEILSDAMPTFAGSNARIVWSVCVETRNRAGLLQDDFPVLVLPARS